MPHRIKFTEKQKRSIIHRYKSGESAQSIAKDHYPRNSKVIVARLREWAVPLRHKNRLKIPPEQKKKIIKLHTMGVPLREIEKEFPFTYAVIHTRLQEWGIKPHKPWIEYEINHNAFSKVTPDSLYFAGYLMADGCIQRRKYRGSAEITLTSIDRDIIKKFHKFLETNRPIGCYPTCAKDAYTSNFSSEQIADDLCFFGIFPQKTGKELVPFNRLEVLYSRDFWRGVVDGDGCIDIRKRDKTPRLSLVSANKLFLKQFKTFLNHHGLKGTNKIHTLKRKTNNAYQYQVSGKLCLPILNLLYIGARYYLNRKYDKAMKILQGNILLP